MKKTLIALSLVALSANAFSQSNIASNRCPDVISTSGSSLATITMNEESISGSGVGSRFVIRDDLLHSPTPYTTDFFLAHAEYKDGFVVCHYGEKTGFTGPETLMPTQYTVYMKSREPDMAVSLDRRTNNWRLIGGRTLCITGTNPLKTDFNPHHRSSYYCPLK